MSDLNSVLLDSGQVDRVTVFTAWLPREGSALEDRGDRYRIVRYPALELIPNFPVPKLWTPSFWRALRLARPSAHDVFVSHTRFFLSSVLALLCARVLRRPLLHVEHGSDYVQLSGRGPRTAARIYDLTLGRLVLRRADGVVAISHAAADFVQRLAGRESRVIHRGVWVERLDAAPADADVLEWARGRPVVTFAGRLIDGKGVADLLNAFAGLAGVDAVLCIVGDGPRRAQLEALAVQLGISGRTLFRGYVPEEQAWSVVRAADVVVNPSYTEGLPTSVLEAALLGKPVLATDVGGTSEIVTDGRGGLLFAPHDVDGLRSRLERALGDEALREQLGKAARGQAAAGFDWHASAKEFVGFAHDLRSSLAGR